MRIQRLLTGLRRTRAVLGLTAVVALATALAAPSVASASGLAGDGMPKPQPCRVDCDHHASHTVDITGVDFRFLIDTHGFAVGGLTDVRFHNRGHVDHQAQLFRLNDGVTQDEFKADLANPNPAALFADSVPAGGAAVVHPHDGQQVWDPLQGGTYAVVCFVPDEKGVPHFALGMVGFFELHGTVASERLDRLHPAVEVEEEVITAHDLTYTIPRVLSRNSIYKFVNTDASEGHEINLGRLKPGKTVADAKAYFQRLTQPGGPGPAPFVSEGGHGAILPGSHGWFKVTEDRGHYVAFCLVPDDKTGVPHAAEGMVVGVDVR
jgi:hypothetical protein